MRRLVPPLIALTAIAGVLGTGTLAVGAGSDAPLEVSTHHDANRDEVLVIGRRQNNEVRVFRQGTQPGELVVQSVDGSNNPHTWLQVPYGQYTTLNASLGDGRDSFSASTPLPGMELAVSTGRGDDVIDSAHVDRVYGGPGNDAVRGSGLGGPGFDVFTDSGGADEMRGGDGPDLLLGGQGGDLLDGGPGPGRDRCKGGAPGGVAAQHLPAAKRDRAIHCEQVSGVP
jgi:hypothetical protein